MPAEIFMPPDGVGLIAGEHGPELEVEFVEDVYQQIRKIDSRN